MCLFKEITRRDFPFANNEFFFSAFYVAKYNKAKMLKLVVSYVQIHFRRNIHTISIKLNTINSVAAANYAYEIRSNTRDPTDEETSTGTEI